MCQAPQAVDERDECKMSIYKQVLGERFYSLNPMLQRRYEYIDDKPFQAKGVMKKISGGPKWLYPLIWLGTKRKLLFPEKGCEVPFKIVNTPCVGECGEKQVHWERIFYFKNKVRYFNALMSLDLKRGVIKDYLGEPSPLYSDLTFFVSPEGNLLITSGKQRLVLGPVELPLPKLLQGNAAITEKYDEEKGVFLISVEVRNPLVGTVFSYEGEFLPDEME